MISVNISVWCADVALACIVTCHQIFTICAAVTINTNIVAAAATSTLVIAIVLDIGAIADDFLCNYMLGCRQDGRTHQK
jgi:hypothetical protein